MKPTPRLGLIALTHALAIAVGWAAYQASGFQGPCFSTTEPPAARTKSTDRTSKDTKTTDRTPKDTKAAEEILAPILAFLENRRQAYDQRTDDTIRQTSQDILDRIASIDIPTDFAKELEAVEAGPDEGKFVEMAALVFHWMNHDSKAFFDWLRADPKKRGVGLGVSLLFSLEPEIYRRSGVEGVLAQLVHAEGCKHQLSGDLGRSLAKSGDIAGILKARQLLIPDAHASNPEDWRRLVINIGQSWPADKTTALVRLAVEMDEPMLLTTHRRNIDGHGGYIAGLLADESLPEDFRKKISENPMARNSIIGDSSLPLDMRLANGGDLARIISGDVAKLLNSDRDWAFAFRNGQATAEEIMTVVAAGTPDLAKSQPDELRNFVFRELSEEDPAAAMVLLKDMPEDKRSEFALFVSRTHFNDVEPSKFLELLEQIPSDTPEQWDDRLDAWNLRGYKNNERLQEGYVEWVRALPPSLDREMALYSLARAVNAKNPGLAEDLRSQVSDPELKKRIASHR